MRSNNPVFARSAEFNGRSSQPASPYGDPSQWDVAGQGGQGAAPTHQSTDRMTMDSVVQKSAITIGIVFVVAAITWIMLPDPTDLNTDMGSIYMASMAGGAAAFALSLVNAFKKVVSPALVMAFAAAEGVALGAISMFFESMYPGVVMSAVLGTFGAFAGTLAVYKFFNIQVGDKFRKGVMAGMFGMVGLGLLSMVLSVFGVNLPFFGNGPIGFLFAVAGLVLGIFMLILDYDMIERGVSAGIPERESWRAAFGLLVSLVWIYTNLLRILAMLQSD